MSGKKSHATGRVIVHHGLKAIIETKDGIIEFKPPRRESWVVGDTIQIVDGRPKTIEPRRNELARESSRKGAKQVLAANLDWLVIVTSCGEAYKPGLIDRFLVAAGHAGIGAMIVLNKIDLPGADDIINELEIYSGMGYMTHAVSAKTGEGADSLAVSLQGALSAMVGHSGVGKTSLLNRISPEEDGQVGEVHEATERGRHTTTSSRLVKLPGGGELIDSPGVRLFSPTGLEPADVAQHFPGFSDHIQSCRFRDCMHLAEPGCGVAEAVKQGAIGAARYESYERLMESVKESSAPAWRKGS